MRKVILLFTLFLFNAEIFAQEEKVYEADNFVWCGLDYSNVRCIGPAGFNDPEAIKDKYFDAWNQLVLNEASKYDLEEAYDKSQTVDLSVVNRRNDLPVVGEFVINEPYAFDGDQLKKIISDYNLKSQKEGIGLVYVVEALNKTTERAAIHTVFFDIATKEILWSRKFIAAAGGFGFRNYWARPIYEVIKDSRKVMKRAKKDYYKSLK
ncbi:MAG: hypothetical protein ABJH05_04300 [Fulvivirga sp.]